jgi:regulator of protease activity HflC (stomatin/prohibitin superfamily)
LKGEKMFGINIVPQGNAVVVERLGKFHRVLQSGVNFVIPIFETKRKMYIAAYQVGVDGVSRVISQLSEKIDLREQVFDFPKQSVITSDNVSMEIDAVLYYKIVSPEKAVYGISNVVDGIQKLVQTSLRNVVGQMTLDETLSSRENINDNLRVILDEATDAWGVKVTRIELQEITPSKEIRQRMELQMTAEREKRANILTAEGEKQSAVLKAEGESIAKIKRAEADKQSRILDAEGLAEARLTIADSEAEAIDRIGKIVGKGLAKDYLLLLKYLESLQAIADGQATKVFMPFEAANLLGSMGGIKELFGRSE